MTSIEPQSESLSHLRHEDEYENEKGAEGVSPTEPEVIAYPEGGLRAWFVALGSGGNVFCTFGYVNSFGVLQEYYQVNQLQHRSPSEISWIGSLQIFFLFGGSLFGGPLFDRYGSKILWPSVAIYIFSIMMTSICTEYYQFILAQGVLGGLALGMCMMPGMAATGQYFHKRRAAAMGCAVAGSSLGGVIFPIMLTKMLPNPQLGFGWTIRIIGFMMLAIMGASCAAIRPRFPSRKEKFFLPEAFKDIRYLLVIAAAFMAMLGMFIPPFYLPTFAIENGMSTRLAPYLVAVYNATSFFGRVIPGILADKFGRFNIFFAAATSSAVLGFCWQAMTSNAAIIVFAALYGFCSGAIVSMMSVCMMAIPKSPNEMGTYMGMGFGAASFATLIGPPISGAILSAQGFGRVADFSGAVSLAGGIIVAVAKYSTGNGLFSLH